MIDTAKLAGITALASGAHTPNGGAMFAASSMTWATSLPVDGYDNDVSVVMANVVRRFAADEPIAFVLATDGSDAGSQAGGAPAGPWG